MDHLNLAIDISHGWINGVVELYLLVLIWVLFNIHASASGGWPGGKRFALCPSFLRASVSQNRSWATVTYHEMACLKALTQETEGQEIGSAAEDTTLRLSPPHFQIWGLTSEQEGTLRKKGFYRKFWGYSGNPLPAVCILGSKRKAEKPIVLTSKAIILCAESFPC